MIWLSHNKNGVIMVYCFANETDKEYCGIMTLHPKNHITMVYGFHVDSTHPIDLIGWYRLWKCVKAAVPTRYLLFEALPHHADIYNKYLPVIKRRFTTIFRGYKAEILKIDLQGNIMGEEQFTNEQV